MFYVRARLTDDAGAAWTQYAETQGVTVTGLLEAIGEQLADPAEAPNLRLAGAVRRAREVDAGRRRTTRRGP